MTTNHSALEDLRKTGAPIVKARVVDDGDLVSGAGGVRLGLDIALWLVERYFGPTTAASLENPLEYEWRDPLRRSPASRTEQSLKIGGVAALRATDPSRSLLFT